MNLSCSGVILAGGRSSRFGGENKAFLELGGRPLIQPVISLLQKIFQETMIVTNAPLQYLQWDVALFTDIFSIKSSLTGIHTALFYAGTDYVFVAACDTPFIRESVVDVVLSAIEPGAAAVMPETPSGVEPLFAVYSKKALPLVERHVRQEKLKIQQVFRNQKVIKIPPDRIMEADPELETFFNINTTSDLEKARLRFNKKQGTGDYRHRG